MEIKNKRLVISFVINIIIIILFISSVILEIIDIQNNPSSVYKNVWGLFRFFTIDGNLFSTICCIILVINQIRAMKNKDKIEIQKKILISHCNYMIGLMSACTDFIIFIVVMLVLFPLSGKSGVELINTYKASSLHITNPILLNVRFLLFDTRERDLPIYEKFFGGIPMFTYGIILSILCASKAFTGYGDVGDGNIPYPFLDFYHQNPLISVFGVLFVLIIGFAFSVLLDFLNKKLDQKVLPYDFDEIKELKDIKEIPYVGEVVVDNESNNK